MGTSWLSVSWAKISLLISVLVLFRKTKCTVIFIHAGEDHKNPTVCWQWTKHEEKNTLCCGMRKKNHTCAKWEKQRRIGSRLLGVFLSAPNQMKKFKLWRLNLCTLDQSLQTTLASLQRHLLKSFIRLTFTLHLWKQDPLLLVSTCLSKGLL